MIDRMYVSMYAWWNSFKPIAFVLDLIKSIKPASILVQSESTK